MQIEKLICPVCSSEVPSVFWNGIDVVRCDVCTHMFQADLKISVSYDGNYILDYFEHNSLRQMSLLRAGFVLGSTSKTKVKPSILDVGFGSGDFLRVMRKENWDIWGADLHTVDLGIPRITIEEATKKKWDVVTFFDSLEHFSDFSFLSTLNSDCIIVSIPHSPICPNGDWKHYKPGEHLHYFTSRSICELFRIYGYVYQFDCYVEDIIRGKLKNKEPNICTYVFKRFIDD